MVSQNPSSPIHSSSTSPLTTPSHEFKHPLSPNPLSLPRLALKSRALVSFLWLLSQLFFLRLTLSLLQPALFLRKGKKGWWALSKSHRFQAVRLVEQLGTINYCIDSDRQLLDRMDMGKILFLKRIIRLIRPQKGWEKGRRWKPRAQEPEIICSVIGLKTWRLTVFISIHSIE